MRIQMDILYGESGKGFSEAYPPKAPSEVSECQ